MLTDITGWVPPMKDETGQVVRDRYKLTLNGKEGEAASEWGAIGHILALIRRVSDDGKAKVCVTVQVSRCDDAPDGQSDAAKDADAEMIMRQLAAMLAVRDYL